MNDSKGSGYAYASGDHDRPYLKLPGVARLTRWATPTAHDAKTPKSAEQIAAMRALAKRRTSGGPPGVANLNEQVAQLAAWATARANDDRKGALRADERQGKTGHDLPTLASWATPAARDHKGEFPGHTGAPGLPRLATWATPVSTELGNTLENYRAMKANMASGPRSAITHPSLQAQLVVSGTPPTGSRASTARTDRLNPAHSRWLQAYPIEWDDCAAMVTRSSSTRPSRSSSPRSKRGG